MSQPSPLATMVGRVARAMFENRIHNRAQIAFADTSESNRRKYRQMAEIAIAAMRTPTDEMAWEATCLAPTWDDTVSRAKWAAMIDAALKAKG